MRGFLWVSREPFPYQPWSVRSVLARYVAFDDCFVDADTRNEVPDAPDAAAIVCLADEFEGAFELQARMSFELLHHGSDRYGGGYFEEQVHVVVISVCLSDVERRVQKFSFLEARQEFFFDIGLEEFHPVFRTPHQVVFELVGAMPQVEGSHGYSLALAC